MPAPGFLSDVALWPWYLPHSEDRAITLDFVDDNGDPTDPGVVTVDAGAAWAVPATVAGTGSSRTVTWDAEQTVALADGGILGGKWRLRIDGVYKMGGQIRASSPTAAPTSGAWTVALPTGTGTLTVTIAAGGGGTVDHEVVLFANDVDMSGGSWTDLPNYSGGTIPRAYLAGVSVLVVAGDDLGLWTITASGPCTAGAALAPGESIGCTAGGTGWSARTDSADNTTVSGVTVMAKDSEVRSLSTTVGTLSGGVDDIGATLGTLNTTVDGHTTDLLNLAKNASEAATGLALTNHADTIGTVLAWAECGWGDEAGDMVRGYWSCPVLLPTPTTSWFTRAMVRSLSGSLEELNYQEVCSEPMDSLGVPGDGGAWDHDELALLNQGGAVSVFQEWTAAGDTTEWQTAQDPVVDPPYGPGVPPGRWVEIATAVPDFSTGILYLLGRTDHGTYVDPWDGDKWRILCTYDLGGPFTVEDTTAVEMWIGRGGGRFDIARVRRTYDGTLVSDFNPLAGGNGSTTIADQALLDGNDDPAIWTAHDNAVNVNND